MFDCSVTLRRSREANPAIRYYLLKWGGALAWFGAFLLNTRLR
ncbi:MAG: hypothetical protein N2B60_09980 [Psychrobacter sp.]